MPDRDWDRNREWDRHRDWDRERRTEPSERFPGDRPYGGQSERSYGGWGPYGREGENDRDRRSLERDRDRDRGWDSERDWRTYRSPDRSSENSRFGERRWDTGDRHTEQPEQRWGQRERGSEREWDTRGFDTRQYRKEDYSGRDFGREDRYRDDQNRDWETRRWESSRQREQYDPRLAFEKGGEERSRRQRDFTHGGREERRETEDPGTYPSTDRSRFDYAQRQGVQAYSGTGTGFTGSGYGGMLADAGRYSGRGPKNWQRSDDRIREDVNEELTRHPEIDATDIDVSVSSGEVTLTGHVGERGEKHEAEECAWRVPGVRDVHNQVRVKQGIGGMIASVFKGDDKEENR